MSSPQEHTEERPPSLTQPKQMAIAIVVAFLLPILVIALLVSFVTAGTKVGAGSDALTTEAIGQRIAPVAGFELIDANAPKVYKSGEQVFSTVCSACHTAGVAGAPKIGDPATWAPFIKAGYESMLNAVLHGKGAMPPKGGNPTLSDYEVARAVVYMANQSGASLPEPSVPDPPSAQPVMNPSVEPAATLTTAPPAPLPTAAPAPQLAASATIDPSGEKLYKSHCFACHGSGIAGAPKLGDKTAWEPYIKNGLDAMVKVAITGKGVMPPKGGAVNATEADIRAAVQYMVNAVQ